MGVAVLAIATAALGFALWQQDFDLTYPTGRPVEVVSLYWITVFAPFVAAIFYFFTFVTARRNIESAIRRYGSGRGAQTGGLAVLPDVNAVHSVFRQLCVRPDYGCHSWRRISVPVLELVATQYR